VLIVWIGLGLAAIAAGHHAPVRFAARRAWKPAASIEPDAASRTARTRPAGSNHSAIGVSEPPRREITPTTAQALVPPGLARGDGLASALIMGCL